MVPILITTGDDLKLLNRTDKKVTPAVTFITATYRGPILSPQTTSTVYVKGWASIRVSCTVRLKEDIAPSDDNYDPISRFTRVAGRHPASWYRLVC